MLICMNSFCNWNNSHIIWFQPYVEPDCQGLGYILYEQWVEWSSTLGGGALNLYNKFVVHFHLDWVFSPSHPRIHKPWQKPETKRWKDFRSAKNYKPTWKHRQKRYHPFKHILKSFHVTLHYLDGCHFMSCWTSTARICTLDTDFFVGILVWSFRPLRPCSRGTFMKLWGHAALRPFLRVLWVTWDW